MYLNDMKRSCSICGAKPSKSSNMITTGGGGPVRGPLCPALCFFLWKSHRTAIVYDFVYIIQCQCAVAVSVHFAVHTCSIEDKLVCSHTCSCRKAVV